MSELYAVFGSPVAHSKSPLIHAVFAKQLGETVRYEAREAPPDGFEAAWRQFVAEGGRGANVTLPFKQQAAALADRLSERAALAAAVNTLIIDADELVGDNTDGVGLLRDLERLGAPLNGARIAVLGAGGAVRGVLGPLLAAGPQRVAIANRTVAKAHELAALFKGHGGAIEGCGFEALGEGFDLVINATSASLAGELPPLPERLIADGGVAYDMMYAAEPTVFMQWAAARRACCHDGLGMLVSQAAESWFQWRGSRPDPEPVLARLRAELR